MLNCENWGSQVPSHLPSLLPFLSGQLCPYMQHKPCREPVAV